MVESLCLTTYYVLFFIELGSRRVHLAGVTSHPDGAWVAQQARQFVWQLDENPTTFRCLIRDNDRKFTGTFDAVFNSKQIAVVPTPVQAPNANAYAERWVRSVRQECLNWVLILNEQHLRRLLKVYIAHYNTTRPHQALDQQTPIPSSNPIRRGRICRRQLLGGIINEYFQLPTTSLATP